MPAKAICGLGSAEIAAFTSGIPTRLPFFSRHPWPRSAATKSVPAPSSVKTNTVKPGKGGAYNQVELKNLINGTKLNERFRSAETVEQVDLEYKDFSFLYEQGEALVFMDTESYEQLELQKDFVGERAAFLQDGMMVTVRLYGEKPIGVSLPDQVVLAITEADPVVKGQTAASSYKPAILENGIRVLVPPFIEAGERILVDTNEITYLRRAD